MKSSEKVSFFAIFRTKYLRTSVVLFIFWLCLMQIYNGTTLELGKLSKNIYTSTVSFMYIYMHFITSYNPKMVYKLPQGIHQHSRIDSNISKYPSCMQFWTTYKSICIYNYSWAQCSCHEFCDTRKSIDHNNTNCD